MKEVLSWIRPNVLELSPYESARDVLQTGLLLDANENPYAHESAGIPLNRYPDPNQHELRRAIAAYAGLSAENILAGSGSDEVLDWIFKVFCQPSVDRVAIFEPTYGMYSVMADIFGVSVEQYVLDRNFQFKADAFLEMVPEDVKVLFLCSPNNPTGNLLVEDEILEVASRWSKPVVVDEAYIEFAGRPSLARQIERFQNLIIMRTFSKAWGCAGLRLGYALADPGVIETFRKVKAPYNLSSFTQKAGIQVLGDLSNAAEEVDKILEERARVAGCLREMPLVETVYKSEANFILFRCRRASSVCQSLLVRGIVVRDRSSVPGLPDCIRVTIGAPDENTQFLRSLEEILEGGAA